MVRGAWGNFDMATVTNRIPAVTGFAAARPAAATLGLLMLQLALAALVIHLYAIEGPAFFRIFLLAVAGFAVTQLVKSEWRMPFFALLSIAAVFLVFAPADAAWLVASALTLIALCHLPIPLWGRVVILILTGTGLAVARAGVVESPWSAAVWPILGSMFMFRLAIYLRALPNEPRPGRIWAALGYFFMLPNLVFPLFPVIDYQTFRRSHFDKDPAAIYQQGMVWIARGLVHLVLYRLVYHRVLNNAADVAALGDLTQWMLGTFLLYLRVSGMFHLIVGMLHLFGFRLPETHKLYYLARNFTELWRRINIYWKDFMMSFVFYPVYFKVKKLGPAMSVAIATSAVFAMTWLLHSYQWFWLRGGFPVTPQDILFWGLLGALVVYGAVRELNAPPKARRATAGWSLREGLRVALTFTFFCFLWSLWSAQSVGEWIWTLGAAAVIDTKGIVLFGLAFATLTILGGRHRDAASTSRPVVRTVVPLVILLLLMAPGVDRILPRAATESVAALRSSGLNDQDADLQHRGYYEQLDVRARLTTQDQAVPGARRQDWRDLQSTGALRLRNDFMERDLLPSRQAVWNGHSFSTNRFGMRDRDYAYDKPPGTFRIALLGPSHVMGNGVGDGETFEALVEERLNRDFALPGVKRFEILNFGVDGHCLTQQLSMLEERASRFDPDVVVMTTHERNQTATQAYVYRILIRGIPSPYPEFDQMLAVAGLEHAGDGKVPVPFESWRRAARAVGLDPRMPGAEIKARIRRIGGDVSAWTVARFARRARESGARPLLLALNAVIERPSRELPDADAIDKAELPVIDLLGAYDDQDSQTLRVASWDNHPNAAGHRVIADRLYPELSDFISREFGGT